MTSNELKDAIIKLATERKHITFVEIMNKFPDEKGLFSISLPSYENILMWTGMSELLAEAVSELLESHQLYTHSANQLTYLADGGGLTLPLAKDARQYQKPHWFPVTLDKSPPKGFV